MSRVAHPAGPRHGDVLPADHPPAAPQDLNALPAGIWPRGAGRSGRGVLTLGGIDVRELAAEFGTPLYVCDEEDVRSRCREYMEAFGPEGRVFYAAKAFCSRAMLRWVSSEGLGVDVCTGGELEVALSAGVPPEQITMHGNNKTLAELSRAVEAGLGHIVADSFEEIARLAYLTEDAGPQPNVLVRVTTGVEAHTHEFMATAHDDQKFGFSLASGAADEAVRRVIACPGVTFAGLHSHIGSQIFDTAGFEVAAHRVVGLAVRIRDEHGVQIAELDLGGGFGIAYTTEDDAPEVKELAQSLRDIVDGQCRAAGLSRPRLTVEPGRGIVGPSTVSLYTVGTIKDVDGIRTYVSVDGGMSDNIRTALYDASYECVLASRTSEAAPMLSRVVGRHCESGDIVVRHAWLPSDLAPGDLLAVPATGAYCRSLASNYNHVARPAVVAVGAGGGLGASGGHRAARPIIRRETLDDLLSLDIG
ncbi:MAG TPA: diaminopimelate decarboxylase [Streptosporangiaceae bacterium]|nr:diaminopimelate decarboxylase [Streptosporangiaceae bacterium]